MSVGGRSMLAGIGSLGLYFELTGLAAARIDVRALSVVMIPALAMETVCCSCRTCERRGEAVAQKTHHDFMQDTSSSVAHLVKLVDAANTTIR